MALIRFPEFFDRDRKIAPAPDVPSRRHGYVPGSLEASPLPQCQLLKHQYSRPFPALHRRGVLFAHVPVGEPLGNHAAGHGKPQEIVEGDRLEYRANEHGKKGDRDDEEA